MKCGPRAWTLLPQVKTILTFGSCHARAGKKRGLRRLNRNSFRPHRTNVCIFKHTNRIPNSGLSCQPRVSLKQGRFTPVDDRVLQKEEIPLVGFPGRGTAYPRFPACRKDERSLRCRRAGGQPPGRQRGAGSPGRTGVHGARSGGPRPARAGGGRTPRPTGRCSGDRGAGWTAKRTTMADRCPLDLRNPLKNHYVFCRTGLFPWPIHGWILRRPWEADCFVPIARKP